MVVGEDDPAHLQALRRPGRLSALRSAAATSPGTVDIGLPSRAPQDRATGALGQDRTTGALGQDRTTGALGQDRTTGALGRDRTTGALGRGGACWRQVGAARWRRRGRRSPWPRSVPDGNGRRGPRAPTPIA